MRIHRRHFLGAAITGTLGLSASRALASVSTGTPPTLLSRAHAALDRHAGAIRHRDVIGLVDFSLPSGHARFQLVDLEGGRVTANWLVSHGRGSDPGNTGWLERFSNRPGSNASSRGAYVMGETYVGQHGRSRRVIGLDEDNFLAASRNIVIHGADYVSAGAAFASGRVGRSEGCFAVSRADIAQVLARLGEGRLLFAWK